MFFRIILLFGVISIWSQGILATPVTIFKDDGSGANPWSVIGGASTDIVHGVAAGDIPSLFPVFQNTQAEQDFQNSTVNPNNIGFIVKTGGFSFSGDASINTSMKIQTSFTSSLVENTIFNLSYEFFLPVVQSGIFWFDGFDVLFDPDAVAGEDNLWVFLKRMVRWVDNPNDNQGASVWERNANLRRAGTPFGTKISERVDDYITKGILLAEFEEISIHGRIEPLQQGAEQQIDIDFDEIDVISEVPEPMIIVLWFIGLVVIRKFIIFETLNKNC